MGHQYFDILKIRPTRDEHKIKRAYKKLALKYHPDQSGDDGSMFRELHRVYTVILNNLTNDSFFNTSKPKAKPQHKTEAKQNTASKTKEQPERIVLKYFTDVAGKQLMSDVWYISVTVPDTYLEEDCIVFCNWVGADAFKFGIRKGGHELPMTMKFHLNGRDLEVYVSRTARVIKASRRSDVGEP